MNTNKHINIKRTFRTVPTLCGKTIIACAITAATSNAIGVGNDECMPHWSEEIPGGGDADHDVYAMVKVEEPSGPALYIGGSFRTVGIVSANGVARWDGDKWSPLGTGVEGIFSYPLVLAIDAFDDGTGQSVYVGGRITEAGGKSVSNIARWDGENWFSVGSGVNGIVTSLFVYDDGNGPALYVGGTFTEAGGKPASRLARWDGSKWTAFDGGPDGYVSSMATFNDGDGHHLVIAGSFSAVGDVEARNIARWDGKQWHPMGDGFDDTVQALTVMDDEAGETLVAGGSFIHSGLTMVNRVAQWDGTAWQPMGVGFPSGHVRALSFDDIGNGSALRATGTITASADGSTSRIVQWDGQTWLPIGRTSHPSTGYALAVFDGVSGPVLYAAGRYLPLILTGATENVIRWTGELWVPPGGGIRADTGGNGAFAATYFDDGDNDYLYIGGIVDGAGDLRESNLVRWDGQAWSSIGSLTGPNSYVFPVYALRVADGGQGPTMYVGGFFNEIDGKPFNHIAAWDGTNWSPLGSGVADGSPWTSVFAIQAFDDGDGPLLIVGGSFSTAGNIDASNIAAWDGESWHALGSGTDGTVNHMVVVDHGDGPLLYVSGQFNSAGGKYAPGLAKWDGREWHPVGQVEAMWWSHVPLAAHDGKLIVGAEVTLPDETSYGSVAVFDGESWSEWSEGLDELPLWFETFDDGNGAALYAGVFVPYQSPEPRRALLMWGGAQWVVPRGGGVGRDDNSEQSYVRAMAVSSKGDELAVGGNFLFAGEVESHHVAILRGCAAQTPGDLNGDGLVNGEDLVILFSAWGPCPDPKESDCPPDLNGDGVVDGGDLLILLMNWS